MQNTSLLFHGGLDDHPYLGSLQRQLVTLVKPTRRKIPQRKTHLSQAARQSARCPVRLPWFPRIPIPIPIPGSESCYIETWNSKHRPSPPPDEISLSLSLLLSSSIVARLTMPIARSSGLETNLQRRRSQTRRRKSEGDAYPLCRAGAQLQTKCYHAIPQDRSDTAFPLCGAEHQDVIQ